MSKSTKTRKSYYELEQLLESYFQPVNPRPEFVSQLKKRLLDSTRPEVRFPAKKYLDYGLISLVSLAGTALILMTGIRAMLTFMSALGIIHFVKSQAGDRQPSPPSPAM